MRRWRTERTLVNDGPNYIHVGLCGDATEDVYATGWCLWMVLAQALGPMLVGDGAMAWGLASRNPWAYGLGGLLVVAWMVLFGGTRVHRRRKGPWDAPGRP